MAQSIRNITPHYASAQANAHHLCFVTPLMRRRGLRKRGHVPEAAPSICDVAPIANGILQRVPCMAAHVSEDARSCNKRCNYEFCELFDPPSGPGVVLSSSSGAGIYKGIAGGSSSSTPIRKTRPSSVLTAKHSSLERDAANNQDLDLDICGRPISKLSTSPMLEQALRVGLQQALQERRQRSRDLIAKHLPTQVSVRNSRTQQEARYDKPEDATTQNRLVYDMSRPMKPEGAGRRHNKVWHWPRFVGSPCGVDMQTASAAPQDSTFFPLDCTTLLPSHKPLEHTSFELELANLSPMRNSDLSAGKRLSYATHSASQSPRSELQIRRLVKEKISKCTSAHVDSSQFPAVTRLFVSPICDPRSKSPSPPPTAASASWRSAVTRENTHEFQVSTTRHESRKRKKRADVKLSISPQQYKDTDSRVEHMRDIEFSCRRKSLLVSHGKGNDLESRCPRAR